MLSPLQAGTLDQHARAPDLQGNVQSTDWPYTKLVFGVVLGAGYACAVLSFLYPFYMYMH
jgi:hypothetical protein